MASACGNRPSGTRVHCPAVVLSDHFLPGPASPRAPRKPSGIPPHPEPSWPEAHLCLARLLDLCACPAPPCPPVSPLEKWRWDQGDGIHYTCPRRDLALRSDGHCPPISYWSVPSAQTPTPTWHSGFGGSTGPWPLAAAAPTASASKGPVHVLGHLLVRGRRPGGRGHHSAHPSALAVSLTQRQQQVGSSSEVPPGSGAAQSRAVALKPRGPRPGVQRGHLEASKLSGGLPAPSQRAATLGGGELSALPRGPGQTLSRGRRSRSRSGLGSSCHLQRRPPPPGAERSWAGPRGLVREGRPREGAPWGEGHLGRWAELQEGTRLGTGEGSPGSGGCLGEGHPWGGGAWGGDALGEGSRGQGVAWCGASRGRGLLG